MSYGLLSALSWGISTLLAAVAARCIGALPTLVIGEAAGLAGYLTLFGLGHFSLRGVGNTAWLLVLAGVIAVTGYLAMYRGLESGHVGLVSAITGLDRRRWIGVLRPRRPGRPRRGHRGRLERLPGHPADRRAAGLPASGWRVSRSRGRS